MGGLTYGIKIFLDSTEKKVLMLHFSFVNKRATKSLLKRKYEMTGIVIVFIVLIVVVAVLIIHGNNKHPP